MAFRGYYIVSFQEETDISLSHVPYLTKYVPNQKDVWFWGHHSTEATNLAAEKIEGSD